MTNHQATPGDERKRQLIALARANLTQAKQGLCSHGISPRICKDVHDEETA